MIKEACVENLAQARNAQEQGADQIELCGRLDLDGLTPDETLVKQVMDTLNIHVKVMVRPRGGDFVYSEKEVLEMTQTIEKLKSMGVKEVVLGALTHDNDLDIPVIEQLAKTAGPMKVTFHKAIDALDDPMTGVKKLLEVEGITAILTSGGKPTAEEGAPVIREMYATVKGKIQIIAAGRITNVNLSHIRALVGVDAYHGKLIVGRIK